MSQYSSQKSGIYSLSSSNSSRSRTFPRGPSFRIGILIPWVAKHLLSSVLSMTPGNFFALKTWNTFEKAEARTGAALVFSAVEELREPTLTKFIFRLAQKVSQRFHRQDRRARRSEASRTNYSLKPLVQARLSVKALYGLGCEGSSRRGTVPEMTLCPYTQVL